MADQITSVQSNADGSYDFGFIFDSGSGVTEGTNIHLAAPASPAPPYTLETAKAAVLPLAATQKAAWMVAVNAAGVIGAVTL